MTGRVFCKNRQSPYPAIWPRISKSEAPLPRFRPQKPCNENSQYIFLLHLFAGDEVEVKSFPMKFLFPSDLRSYWRYKGSLTTPACYETVIWTVFQSPIEISSAQVYLLLTQKNEIDEEISLKQTVRFLHRVPFILSFTMNFLLAVKLT